MKIQTELKGLETGKEYLFYNAQEKEWFQAKFLRRKMGFNLVEFNGKEKKVPMKYQEL